MPTANGPHVVWTLRVRRRLEQALVRQKVQTGQPTEPGAVMTDLQRLFTLAFPRARDIVVHDQYLGFHFHPNEYILLIEIHDGDRTGNYVLKVKNQVSLETEWNAWQSCRFAGTQPRMIYMPLHAVREDNGNLAALLYQDAQEFIGIAQTAYLEDAFLSAVQFGTPTPRSLANAIKEMFSVIDHLQYQSASPVEPAGTNVLLNGNRAIDKYFANWNVGTARDVRRNAITAMGIKQEGFQDPVEFFDYVVYQLRAGAPAANFVPRMLRGSAHGDLHGRNILIGIVDNEAHWPALYDYEDIASDNLLGWDFAKMETELKIRAYPKIFDGMKTLEFAGAIFKFETALSEATEAHRRDGAWPAAAGKTPEKRLFNLLLVLRRLAGKYLGDARQRSGEWLEELYFLLGCYGVYTGKFDNLKENELLAAFLSAGVASARFAYSRKQRFGQSPYPQ